MTLVREVYGITKKLPQHERFILSSQLQRTVISIPSNIAEGSKRHTKKDFSHFLCIAQGSSAELETQLLIAKSEYSEIDYKQAFLLLEEVQRMLYNLSKSIRTQTRNAKLRTLN